MKLYAGTYFDGFADEHRKIILNEINNQNDAYILNVNVDDYTAYLKQKYSLDTPQFYFEDVYVDSVERDIPSSWFPREFFVDEGTTIRREVIVYHIPYSGDTSLLALRPNPFTYMTFNANFDSRLQCLLIEVVNFYGETSRIKQRYDESVSHLNSNYGYLRANCEAFNDDLESYIKSSINHRKQQLLKKNDLLESLGVPIKKKDNVPDTFAIPNPKLKEKIVVKPVVSQNDFKPEPALDDNNFRKILKIINDVGKNFERLPSTYKDKSEEDIRDHILLILDPNFELGSAGGETFNKIGKTDISLRYDSSVVFVAECKYWKGEKVFLKTIDQLLGYLTWRNSRVAIINFVQNKEFSDVLETIKNSIQTHANFIKALQPTDETWFNYKFHLNGDRNRELDLAVISFHLPIMP